MKTTDVDYQVSVKVSFTEAEKKSIISNYGNINNMAKRACEGWFHIRRKSLLKIRTVLNDNDMKAVIYCHENNRFFDPQLSAHSLNINLDETLKFHDYHEQFGVVPEKLKEKLEKLEFVDKFFLVEWSILFWNRKRDYENNKRRKKLEVPVLTIDEYIEQILK